MSLRTFATKKNLFEVWFYAIFYDFIHVYSREAGLTTPWGRNFHVNKNILSLRSFVVASLKKISKKSDFIPFFHDFMHVYSPRSGTDSPRGQNFDVNSYVLSLRTFATKKISLKSNFMQFFMILYMYKAAGQGLTTPWGRNFHVNKNILSLRSFVVASLKKKSLRSLISYHFFMILCMYIAPDQGQTAPGDKILMSTVMSCHFGHLLQKKISLKSDFMQFFYDIIHVYSRGAGADNPLGTKFSCQQEHLVTSVICCCKFKKKSLRSLISCHFFMILCMYIAPGQGQMAIT